MHQAVLGPEFLAENEIGKMIIANAKDVTAVLEKYNVEAFFNGHIEVLYNKEINGVNYYSLTGTKKNENYHNSHYELVIENAVPKVKMYYGDEKEGLEKSLNLEDKKVTI